MRSDFAVLSSLYSPRFFNTGRCVMVVTSQRLLFRPFPGRVLEWILYFSPLFLVAYLRFGKVWPLLCAQEVELRRIKRLRSWNPPFSGPPMIETDEDSSKLNAWLVKGSAYWTFELALDRRARERASIEQKHEHFDAVTSVWQAALTPS